MNTSIDDGSPTAALNTSRASVRLVKINKSSTVVLPLILLSKPSEPSIDSVRYSESLLPVVDTHSTEVFSVHV
jgi:hypothetical protein